MGLRSGGAKEGIPIGVGRIHEGIYIGGGNREVTGNIFILSPVNNVTIQNN
jgi:hypothetical protein